MTNQKTYNPASLIIVIGVYFVINSVLVTTIHNSIAKLIIIGIDIILAVAIVLLGVKLVKDKKNK